MNDLPALTRKERLELDEDPDVVQLIFRCSNFVDVGESFSIKMRGLLIDCEAFRWEPVTSTACFVYARIHKVRGTTK